MSLDEALRVLEQFAVNEVDYVLVGGVALNLHGIARATEDMDVFVRPTPENVARLRQALSAVYTDASIEEIRAQDLSGAYPTLRYVPPEGKFYLDILTRLGSFASYDDLQVEEKDAQGVKIEGGDTGHALLAEEGHRADD